MASPPTIAVSIKFDIRFVEENPVKTNKNLSSIRNEFVANLAKQIREIEQVLFNAKKRGGAVGPLKDLLGLVHSIAGSAGAFELASVSEQAYEIEKLLRRIIEEKSKPTLNDWGLISNRVSRLARAFEARTDSNVPNYGVPSVCVHTASHSLVYIVDDNHETNSQLTTLLRENGYRVKSFSNITDFSRALANESAEKPNAIILDIVFGNQQRAGIEKLEEIAATCQADIPIIIMSVRDDLPARVDSLRAGAARYLRKPIDARTLLHVLGDLTGQASEEPYRVLMLDDDKVLLDLYSLLLAREGMEVRSLDQPMQFFEVLDEFDPDVVVLDVYMPGATGPELAAVLRDRPGYSEIPILFLSGENNLDEQLAALGLGGDDFLVKPIEKKHLIAAVSARAKRYRQSRAMARQVQQLLYEKEREHLALNQHAIVSIADRAGRILYVNEMFCRVSGYERAELLGANHRIVKSGLHPDDFYKELWSTISKGQIWSGEICNTRKDRSPYWVQGTIVPFLDKNGKPYQYVSIRTDVTEAKENQLKTDFKNRLQKRINHCAENIVSANADQIDFAIHDAIAKIAEGVGAERAYVLLISDDNQRVECASEWYANGIARAPDDFLNTEHRVATWWRSEVEKYGLCVASSVSSLVDEAEYERTLLSEAGVLSHCSVALRSHGQVIGLIGFDTVSGEREWTHEQLDMLPILGGIVGSGMKRKRAEIALEENKERLRRGQIFANIGTWDFNIQTGELYWSERIAPLFGYPSGDLKTSYENFLEAVYPDDRQLVIDSVNACIERDVPYDIEHRVIWPDGTVRWLSERGAVERSEDGEPLRMLGVVQDIHDRRTAEEALLEREVQLREAQARAKLGNWRLDKTKDLFEWSDETYRIFGYDPGSVKPTSSVFMERIPFDDHAIVEDAQRRSLETGQFDLIHRVQRPDGTVIHVHELADIKHDSAGNIATMTGTVQDITDRKVAEEELIAARDEAERANKAKSSFLSSMSHELRTPMNAILGFGQLLAADSDLSEDNADSAREIVKAGQHLLELINEVLDLSRIESGKTGLSIESISLKSIIDECLPIAKSLARKRGIEIQASLLDSCHARADRTRVKQVILNLLSNAVKYNKDAGAIEIIVEEAPDSRIRISVTDTGPGIPEEYLDEVFEPFNRLDANQGDVEGTGIGLTISKKIIEQLGGEIGVESELGEGSKFWVELPKEASPLPENDCGTTPKSPLLPTSAGESTHTVLYIEDNPANIKLMRQVFKNRENFNLVTALTPEAGLELALTHCPDLILLDINMPQMDGYEVLRVLKKDATLKTVPVIAVTANAHKDDIKRGKAAGFANYITKPLIIDNLNKVIDELIFEAA